MDSEANSVRTAFYMGFYEEALKEAQEMKSSNNENIDVFYFRAMLVGVFHKLLKGQCFYDRRNIQTKSFEVFLLVHLLPYKPSNT